ncbi:MAG: hypothetical protein Q6370_019785 [Candidatus Sigynarchaeota archaeon]
MNQNKRQSIISQYEPLLESIENVVNNMSRREPSMTDKDVVIVYNTLLRVLTRRIDEAEARTMITGLSALNKTLYSQLEKTIVQFDGSILQSARANSIEEIGKDIDPPLKQEHALSANQVSAIKDCLSLLLDSVSLWTNEGGPKGYLNYIRNFFL